MPPVATAEMVAQGEVAAAMEVAAAARHTLDQEQLQAVQVAMAAIPAAMAATAATPKQRTPVLQAPGAEVKPGPEALTVCRAP